MNSNNKITLTTGTRDLLVMEGRTQKKKATSVFDGMQPKIADMDYRADALLARHETQVRAFAELEGRLDKLSDEVAIETLNLKVEQARKANPSLTKERAFVEVVSQDKALANRYYRAQKAANTSPQQRQEFAEAEAGRKRSEAASQRATALVAARADKLRGADPNLTQPQALSEATHQVFRENPDLYRAMRGGS